jgi:hypothetical protein
MRTLPIGHWIANAAAGLTGSYGAITKQAQQAGCSRQSVYDHTFKFRVNRLQFQAGLIYFELPVDRPLSSIAVIASWSGLVADLVDRRKQENSGAANLLGRAALRLDNPTQ